MFNMIPHTIKWHVAGFGRIMSMRQSQKSNGQNWNIFSAHNSAPQQDRTILSIHLYFKTISYVILIWKLSDVLPLSDILFFYYLLVSYPANSNINMGKVKIWMANSCHYYCCNGIIILFTPSTLNWWLTGQHSKC